MDIKISRIAIPITAVLVAIFILFTAGTLQTEPIQEAKRILKATGIKGGLVVHIGCGVGELTAALLANDSYLVHGLDADAINVEKARKYIRFLGIYGKVSVDRLRSAQLPYTDNLVNLIVAENLGEVSKDEVMRVLCPNGVSYVKRGERWEKIVKPWTDEIDEWTHYLHDADNNAVAHDKVVGPPHHMQWVGEPLYCRSHEVESSICALISAKGRIFFILDEGPTGLKDPRLPSRWSLIARDAFNGVLLWKRLIPRWGWREWKKEELAGKDWTELRGQRIRSPFVLPRRLVAKGNRIYVTLGYTAPVTILEAATGEIVRNLEGTEGTDEILCSQDILILCVRKIPAKGARRPSGEDALDTILAIKASTGEVLWKNQEGKILPLSLAIGGNRVFFHNYKSVVCLNLKTGAENWRSPVEGGRGGTWVVQETLVANKDVVLFLSHKKLTALSSETGEIIWTGPGGSGPGVAAGSDLFIADGLVWYGGQERRYGTAEWLSKGPLNTMVEKVGYDLLTGEVKRKVKVQNLISQGHHFRCYRSKATDRYLLLPKRGIEFLDIKGDNHMRHDWLRAPCRLGFMPCNGLLYMPPHQCFCYPGAKLNGFNALAHEVRPERWKSKDPFSKRFEKGPAYNVVIGSSTPSDGKDWLTYRHDPKRSGWTRASVPVDMKLSWKANIGGKITQPVVAGGKLFVASVDAHRISCLNTANGRLLWDYTAGGRVDSPPTIYKGRVIFGSADGWVYCLRASDGELAWRFRAASNDRRVVAFGQVESAWPVHGSVLVKNGIAYIAAGRSSFLDGGIYMCALDPETGKKLYEAHIEGPDPDLPEEPGRPFDMEGALPDVLVSHDKFIYMRNVKFDDKLVKQETPRVTRLGDREIGLHLFSTSASGLLDGSWWDRNIWMYSERWPGFYFGIYAPKAGQILVFNDSTTYGLKCFITRNVHSPWFFPGSGYLLFADDNDTEPILLDTTGTTESVKWLPGLNETLAFKRDLSYNDPAVDYEKGPGFTRSLPPKWTVWVPIRAQAMVLSENALFIAGPPDVIDPDDPLGAFEGRKGAHLWGISASDGSKLTEYRLDSPPVFDGMAAAQNCLYIALQDGKIVCLGKAK